MSDSLPELILAGRLEEALELASGMAFDLLADTVLGLAFESQSLNCYGFVAALINTAETAEHHYMAAELLTASPLNQLPGGYHLAYYHGRRAAVLAPKDPSFREFLLLFHRHPDRMMAEDEGVRIARELLDQDPDNAAAKRVLDL